MEMNAETRAYVIIFSFKGELMGGEESKVFQDHVYDNIQKENVNLVVDMGEVKWMNSSGLGMLMGALTTLRSSGGDLRLANVGDRVRRPIEVTKLDSVIKMYESVDEAVTSYSEGG